ncbi:hypothetical protein MIS46_10775 [Wielerella bovis]|uniref:hypothetical protein n=1 Tax=Wielerella bovis TaxID=2917790 RepID=UPI00201A0647|nr:hypothetical protein [Wielerella bovis]ULJ62419.1 hypothetical protein MIS46_10775 [Wielerella bovis]
MKMTWIERFKLLPVWIIVADLLFGVALNIQSALVPYKAAVGSDGLPISPEIAFNWIQVLVNGVMVIIVLSAIFMLLKMKHLSDHGERLAPTLTRAIAVLAVLAFAMPALLLWFGAAYQFFAHGRLTVTFTQSRYLLVAACQPYLVWVAAMLWRGQHRLYHGTKRSKNERLYHKWFAKNTQKK